MSAWPRQPVIFEINTWVWLGDLSRKYGKPLTLATLPPSEWDALAAHGFDAVWFMGVWERSPAGRAIAMRNPGLLDDFRRALPDFEAQDNVGSPYCVRRYVVDQHLGGPNGLASARRELGLRGIRLILDFVPNHVAPDHPWVSSHPEYFIAGKAEDAQNDPASFIECSEKVFACGRDPYFPAWPDVLQLNAFQPGLRQAAIATVLGIASQCDGIRCDMAMLMLNGVFERTWGERAGPKPDDDYWRLLIPAITSTHQDFKFIAEAYWDLEWELQQQGFDYCYDKKLYDRMAHQDAESIRQHLLGDSAYQGKLLRFIENHDEPRAAAAFAPAKARAAALATLTLPGAKLLHEGQFDGLKVRLPVFLRRRPIEPVDHAWVTFYAQLIEVTGQDAFRHGEWRLCDRQGWPDNDRYLNVLSWCWEKGDERYLIIINYGGHAAQAQVRLPWDGLEGKPWRLKDLLSDASYVRDGGAMRASGLFVDLPPWGSHVFRLLAL